jgi:hypothetical protein
MNVKVTPWTWIKIISHVGYASGLKNGKNSWMVNFFLGFFLVLEDFLVEKKLRFFWIFNIF